MTIEQHHRLITIDGCYNLRDVGGYASYSGATTNWRTLLRSASPHMMPLNSWQPFNELGVRTLIDLRRPSEAKARYYIDRIPRGMQYADIPLFDDEQAILVDEPADTLSDMYQRMLAHCGGQFRKALETIASSEGTVLVHCAVGKDRTGMVVALALGAAGVDNETIAADYSMSSTLLEPLVEEAREFERQRGSNLERLERLFESRHETMIETLEHLDAEYGGFEGYFNRIGLQAETLTALRRKLLS